MALNIQQSERIAKKDLAAAKKYVKKGASMTSVGESYGVTAGSISQRLRRFVERNKKDELAKAVKAKIKENRRNCIILAVAALSLLAASVPPAKAGTCTTRCYGNTCTTTCF